MTFTATINALFETTDWEMKILKDRIRIILPVEIETVVRKLRRNYRDAGGKVSKPFPSEETGPARTVANLRHADGITQIFQAKRPTHTVVDFLVD